MIRIYADFNSTDEQGRVMLNTVGSIEDLERHKNAVTEGAKVLLYMTGDFEVVGTLVFEGIWKAIPEWNSIRYENPDDAPKSR